MTKMRITSRPGSAAGSMVTCNAGLVRVEGMNAWGMGSSLDVIA